MLDELKAKELPAGEWVKASLNFAADRTNGGIWSNLMPERITQALTACPVEVRDARTLPSPPTLEREGFAVRRDPLAHYQWDDQDWVKSVYVPHSLKLVREMTGAAHVAPFYGGVLIRDTGNANRAPAAEFVHLDQTRESAIPFLEMAVDTETRRKYGRVKIFNVWRAITPPPQDVPLALCDQRTLDEKDWVVGRTVEPTFPDGVPYVTSVYNSTQKWHFISGLETDDAVIFKGYDNDPRAPMGCLHGAFRHPAPGEKPVPRASAETRIFALFPE